MKDQLTCHRAARILENANWIHILDSGSSCREFELLRDRLLDLPPDVMLPYDLYDDELRLLEKAKSLRNTKRDAITLLRYTTLSPYTGHKIGLRSEMGVEDGMRFILNDADLSGLDDTKKRWLLDEAEFYLSSSRRNPMHLLNLAIMAKKRLNKLGRDAYISGDLRRCIKSVDKIIIVYTGDLLKKEDVYDINRLANREYTEVVFKHTSPERLGTVLFETTGPLDFVRSIKEKFGGKLPECEDEKEIFRLSGLAYIDPEYRDGTRPTFLLGDIVGDFHVHSWWSDGNNSIAEVKKEAIKLGYEFITFCDHSQNSKRSGGVKISLLDKRNMEISENSDRDLLILSGMELDILDGYLDAYDSYRQYSEVILASMHSGIRDVPGDLTRSYLSILSRHRPTAIAHISASIIARRIPYRFNKEKVFIKMKERGVMLEINGSPQRLSPGIEDLKLAREIGLKFVLSTDCHDKRLLGLWMRWACAHANRAGIPPEMILNVRK